MLDDNQKRLAIALSGVSEEQKEKDLANLQDIGDKVTIDGDLATVTFGWRLDRKSDRQTQTTVFDFSSVSRSDLIRCSLYWAKQKHQASIRDAASQNGKIDPTDFALVDVQLDLINASRKTKDPLAVTVANLRKQRVSQEIIDLVIADYNKKNGGDSVS